jgi:DNA-directed RNA polymerase subunit H
MRRTKKMDHVLVPKHEKLTEEEKQKLFEDYEISFQDLPKIKIKDKAIGELEAQEGDVIKITRPSSTAGEAYFYRGVISN